MRTRYFRTPSAARFVRVANLDDLLGSHDYKELGPAQKRQARQAAKELFVTMMGMVADDMVENKASFVFPRRDFGFMRIGDISADCGGYRYVGSVKNDFRYYGGKVFLNKIVRGCNGGKLYRFKLIRKRHQRMLELIQYGRNYAE